MFNKLQSVIKKAVRYGYLPRSFSTLRDLSKDSDEKLFFLARYNLNHVLHRLLPLPKTVQYNLRKRIGLLQGYKVYYTLSPELPVSLWTVHEVSYSNKTSVRSSNKTLFIECYLVTSINRL